MIYTYTPFTHRIYGYLHVPTQHWYILTMDPSLCFINEVDFIKCFFHQTCMYFFWRYLLMFG
jgi:hypothetical protein